MNRKIAPAQMDDWEASADRASRAAERREALKLQGKARAAERAAGREPVMACGGGREQLSEPAPADGPEVQEAVHAH